MSQKYTVDGSMFEVIVRAAAKQFHTDAQVCGNGGDKRTMAQFLHQAAIAEELYERLDANERVVICADVDAKARGIAKIEELAFMRKHQRKCKNCGEVQSAHANEVKCPFASTLFLPEKL